MSEILRAVLDATCTGSWPTYYTVQMPQPIIGGAVVQKIVGSLQCKTDRWFLMTGATMYAIGGSARYIDLFQFQTFNFIDLKNAKTYFSDPANMIEGNMGENAMNSLTFPEYILWEPNSLIGIEATGLVFNLTYFNYIVLTGIEYAK